VNFLSGTNKESYVTTIKKADILVPCVSAASIIAKVARDKFMSDQDRKLPGYDFSSHVGYGTAKHKTAISELGATKLHRMSFSPLKDIKKTTKKIGDEAEDVAAEYLIRSGHEILNRNWKTKFCEIDIVSIKNNIIYFCEVKYRKSNQYGCGMDVITGRKVDKMKFAAKLYIHNKKLTDIDLRLMAMSMTGTPPNVIECIEV
jgi:ribonuclease HII